MNAEQQICQPRAESKNTAGELTNRVLLLGNDDRVILAVARGLGREGLAVHVAWCDPASPALKSKYVSRFHSIPPYSLDSFEWLTALNRLTQEQPFDLVIPCNDFAVIPLQTARERLSSDTNWYLINDQAFKIAFDKGETGHAAKALGINTPCEFALDHRQVCDASQEPELTVIDGHQLRFPVYVKPRSSITQDDVMNKRSAVRIETPGQLADRFREDCPADGLLIQESFSGDGVGVEVLASEGKVLMQLQHRRLRETIDGGSTYRETIAEIPALSDATHKLVGELNYSGVAMFEFRYNLQTREWVFLEINARFWGSLPLAIASGANFPWGLYQLLVHGRTDFDSNYQVGRRCRNLIKDLRAYRKQKSSKLGLTHLLLGKDHLDFFARDDWRPQLADLGTLFRSLIGKVFRSKDHDCANDPSPERGAMEVSA